MKISPVMILALAAMLLAHVAVAQVEELLLQRGIEFQSQKDCDKNCPAKGMAMPMMGKMVQPRVVNVSTCCVSKGFDAGVCSGPKALCVNGK